MNPVCASGGTRLAKAKEEWNRLSDEERKRLIPIFLQSIVGWRAWSVTDSARLAWLEHRFEEAGVPFRTGRSSNQP